MNLGDEQFEDVTPQAEQPSPPTAETVHATTETDVAPSNIVAEGVPEPAPVPPAHRHHHHEPDGWIASAQSLFITVVIAVFVITFIVQAFEIPSGSMENTLLIGDYLLVDKAHYGPSGHFNWVMPYDRIRRGDIIVFLYPVHPAEHFVKRVIGLPGDRVHLVHKVVYVNDKPLNEPYTIYRRSNYDSFRDNFPSGNRYSADIDSKWYVLMDRLVEDGQLIVPEGHYFVMGDNRDDSSDSRYWGFVPRENIIGRPLLTYFSMKTAESDDRDEDSQDDKLSLRRLIGRLTHDIRWSRMLRLIH